MRLNDNPGYFTEPWRRRANERAVHAELLNRADHNTTHWTDDALCTQVGAPDMWFPETGADNTKDAKAICAKCPVRETCLEYALDNHLEHGIFGGTTRNERRVLRKERGVPEQPSQRVAERDALAKKVRALIKEGYTDGETAVRLGVSGRTVTRVRKEYGIKPHPFNVSGGAA